MVNFIVWCLLGGTAGWYFGIRSRRDALSEVRRSIGVGIVGGTLGGALFDWSAPTRLPSAASVLTAFAGAMILLAMGNWFFRSNGE